MLRSIDAGESWTALKGKLGIEFPAEVLAENGNGVLFGRAAGLAIYRSIEDGETWQRHPTELQRTIYQLEVLPSTGTLLGFDFRGGVFRSTNSGETWTSYQVTQGSGPAALTILQLFVLDETDPLFIVGSGGRLLRSIDDGETWTHPETGVDVDLRSILKLERSGTLLSYGDNGTVLRSTDNGITWSQVATGTDADLLGLSSSQDELALFLRGESGTLVRSMDDGVTWTRYATGTASRVVGLLHLTDSGVVLARDDRGQILRGSENYITKFSELAIEDATIEGSIKGDEQLLQIFSTLPKHAREAPRFSDIRIRLEAMIARRNGINGSRTRAQERLSDLGKPALLSGERQAAFGKFMASCRSGSSREETVAACAKAWTDDQAATREGWWETLAKQAPLGILLIFLLALLGGLYRYSQRMAGFHASRADALELLAKSIVKPDVEKLEQLANTFAADKVEFKDSRTPADQAVEIAKAINARA